MYTKGLFGMFAYRYTPMGKDSLFVLRGNLMHYFTNSITIQRKSLTDQGPNSCAATSQKVFREYRQAHVREGFTDFGDAFVGG